MVALLLAVFWLPASSHVLLEQSGLIHSHLPQLHAATALPGHDGELQAETHAESHADAHTDGTASHPNESHDAADGRCLRPAQDSALKAPAPAMTPALLTEAAWLVALLATHPVRPQSGLAPPGDAPPELARQWQFVRRAALPVRAPSPNA